VAKRSERLARRRRKGETGEGAKTPLSRGVELPYLSFSPESKYALERLMEAPPSASAA